MTLIKCKKCKKEISNASVACVHCGEPNEMKLICPECHKETNYSSTICNNCGYQHHDLGIGVREYITFYLKSKENRGFPLFFNFH